MGETDKYIREKIVQVIIWQCACFLLVVGFSLNDHGYFELRDSMKMERARIVEAEDKLSAALKDNPIDLARHKLFIAQAKLKRVVNKKERFDAVLRALGLIIVATILAFIFPKLIWMLYKQLGEVNSKTDIAVFSEASMKRATIIVSIAMLLVSLLVSFF